ncbi:hypothetical protein FOZ62_016661, partial [Perkinsus olseni]
ICGNGTYCMPGTTTNEINDLDPNAPRKCVEGYFCQANETTYRGQGECPVGHYCVRASLEPVLAPKGYFVDYTGAYTPSRCKPGTYQDEIGQVTCKACPDGHECTQDGTYRSIGDPSFTEEANIFCHPCRQGTWNYRGQLTSELMCENCPSRYVCAREGLTVFAPKEQTDCTPNEDGVALCYQLSQANDCPEGFACGDSTTAYTQYDYPCEPGYYCKSLTALHEMRFLLCPAGFYCKQATGASKKEANTCPTNWYCPEGTSGLDLTNGTEVVLDLKNVQSWIVLDAEGNAVPKYVQQIDPETGSVCKRCDDETFIPPSAVNTSDCLPCGVPQVIDDAGGEVWVPNEEWASLKCPEGTSSIWKSSKPDDCKQIGVVIAVVNLYANDTVTYPGTGEQVRLWDPERELRWMDSGSSEYQSKTTYRYGQPISNDDETLVEFIGFDQRKDTDRGTFHFTNLKLGAFDIVHVYFEFSKIASGTRLSTRRSSGHYDIVITSNKLGPLQQEIGYDLPNHLEESDGELFHDFELKLLALEEDVVFNISLNLLHGSHLKNLHYFNETVRMNIMRPNRADWGRPKTFLAILNRELLSGKGFELPYNMPPGLADTPGDPSMVVDMANEKDIAEDRTIASNQMPGGTFWNVMQVETVALPWLPFFSSCDYFDSHIVIWDLLENPDKPAEAGTCKIPNKEDVKPVPPLFIDLSTLEVTMEANSDECSLTIPCRYEDPMVNHLNTPWMSIDEETKLYYLTRDPRSFEDFARGADLFDSLVGTDNLVGVTFVSGEREGAYPRSVSLSIAYKQEGTEYKKIVEAGMEVNDFDDDFRRLDYNLTIEYKPMVWSELMNAFQLPLSVYCVLFALIGALAVVVTWLSWLVMRIGVKRVQSPRFQLAECFEFMLLWPIQGVCIASLLVVVLSIIIKVTFTDFADPFQGIGCSWPQAVGTSGAAEEMDTETCKQARMGESFLLAGLMMLWSGSKLMVPKLRDVEVKFLVQRKTDDLQQEGIPIPASRSKMSKITSLPVKWKRFHLLWCSILLVLALMVMMEFSYSDFFGTYTVNFIVGFTFMMMAAEAVFARAVRETLLLIPLLAACEVVLFIATMGADNFQDFAESFF